MSQPLTPELTELHACAVRNGEHFYTDPGTGFMVFTALYHLQRGFCCRSACRHCPYEDND